MMNSLSPPPHTTEIPKTEGSSRWRLFASGRRQRGSLRGTMATVEWWKVSETVVYTRGILGECPARGETSLSPIDTHPLPRQTVIAWALVYDERIEAETFGRALSDVLRDYPTLAGRFGPDGKVLHNNGGVPVVVGKSSGTSSDLSPTPILEDVAFTASARSPPPYLNPMNLSKVYQSKDAIVSFRLTYLGDGGTVLGVTIPHAIVDGRSLASFLSALSLCYQGEEYPRPFLDRRVLTYQPLAETMTKGEIEAFHSEESVSFSDWNASGSSRADAKLDLAASVASGLSKYHSRRVHPSAEGAGPSLGGGESEVEEEEVEDLAAKMSVWQSLGHLCRMFWQFAKGGKLRTVVVRIDREELAAIKAKAAEGGESVSRNDIAVAYAWILMRKLQGRLGHLKRTDREDQSRMLFAADLRVRDRMENLSETYFGNAALAVGIDGPRTMSLVDCAALVRRAVSDLKPTKTKR